MTTEERDKVVLETRHECARIAYFESKYWQDVETDDETLRNIAIGAVGAASNICASILLGKSAAEVKEEVAHRGKKEVG